MDYGEFLNGKRAAVRDWGFDVGVSDINRNAFPFQVDIVRWALRKGRAAVFAGCGLGKTLMQLEWARLVSGHTGKPVLILVPLAVARQTRDEGRKFGIGVTICRSQADARDGINVTNYEMLHTIDPVEFSGVVLDESGIIKSFAGKTRNDIIEKFAFTWFKLACTATPAPNDYVELGNHSEFLGVMTRAEMLSMFFINDTKDTGNWRLRGHVRDNVFWEWLASWSVMFSSPDDLGYEIGGFLLPEIMYHEHVIESKAHPGYGFFNLPVTDLNSRRKVRKETLNDRCRAAADLINSTDNGWVVWCNLNAEGEMLTRMVDGAVEVAGRHKDGVKESRMLDFAQGKIRRLVTKPSIAGHGMNWQVCSRAAFVGLNDSWEEFFQAVRRIWRFGQERSVEIHIFIEEREDPVLENIRRKDINARKMVDAMVHCMRDFTKTELTGSGRDVIDYRPEEEMRLPKWLRR